jgi:hypothetical protein
MRSACCPASFHGRQACAPGRAFSPDHEQASVLLSPLVRSLWRLDVAYPGAKPGYAPQTNYCAGSGQLHAGSVGIPCSTGHTQTVLQGTQRLLWLVQPWMILEARIGFVSTKNRMLSRVSRVSHEHVEMARATGQCENRRALKGDTCLCIFGLVTANRLSSLLAAVHCCKIGHGRSWPAGCMLRNSPVRSRVASWQQHDLSC